MLGQFSGYLILLYSTIQSMCDLWSFQVYAVYPLSPVCAIFFARCASILRFHNSPTDQARELLKPSADSESPLVYFKNKHFLFCVLCGLRHNGSMISRLCGWGYLDLGANPKSNFFGSRFFWSLRYHQSFTSPWLACYHIWSQTYGSKTKIG